MRSAIAKLRRADVALNVTALLLAVYLAVANLLRGAEVPNEATWRPWQATFVLMLVAALFVPLFAFYKFLDARLEKLDKQQAEGDRLRALEERGRARSERDHDRDTRVFCQQIAAALARACPQLNLDEFAVQVWICLSDGTFGSGSGIGSFCLITASHRVFVGVREWAW